MKIMHLKKKKKAEISGLNKQPIVTVVPLLDLCTHIDRRMGLLGLKYVCLCLLGLVRSYLPVIVT